MNGSLSLDFSIAHNYLYYVKGKALTKSIVLKTKGKTVWSEKPSFSFTPESLFFVIKGSSDCGKTTVVKLLFRYCDASERSITVDGVLITDYGLTYGCMSVVRQETVLFRDTLRNDLTMFGDVPDEKLVKLLNGLELSKFASREALDSVIE